MGSRETPEIHVVIHGWAPALYGQVTGSGAAPQAFEGWLELIVALMAQAPPEPDPRG